MLKKIDCVMIHVDDLTEVLDFYSAVFGLKPIWQNQDEGQAGLLFPASDSEIVLCTDPERCGLVEVYYRVEDLDEALQRYVAQGCTVLTQPFDLRLGRCAVIQDPFGIRLRLLDVSRAAAETAMDYS